MKIDSERLKCLSLPYKQTTVCEVYRAFFMKEYKIWIGYGSLILLDFIQMIQPVVIYYFIAVMLNQQGLGMDYFSFVTIGIAFSHFVYEIMMSLDWNLRREKGWGTISSVFSTPITPLNYAIGTYSCYFAYSWFYVIIMLSLSWLLMNIKLIVTFQSVIISVVAVILMVTSHIGLGFCAVGGNILSNKVAPIATAFSWAQDIFSGKFFSVSVFKFPLNIISYILPLRYSLSILRAVLIDGQSIKTPEVYANIIILAMFSLILIPTGYYIMNYSFKKAIAKGMM